MPFKIWILGNGRTVQEELSEMKQSSEALAQELLK